jgi:threonylcarbamoyladenosine tRNA methylthiotransferase MtaB
VSAKYDPLLINELKKVRLMGINEQGLMEVAEAETEAFAH